MMSETRSLSAEERETTIWTTDADELVHIWSAQKKHITKMRKDAAFTEVRSGHYGVTEFAEFTIPVDLWSPLGVVRRRNYTTDERNDIGKRLSGAQSPRP